MGSLYHAFWLYTISVLDCKTFQVPIILHLTKHYYLGSMSEAHLLSILLAISDLKQVYPSKSKSLFAFEHPTARLYFYLIADF